MQHALFQSSLLLKLVCVLSLVLGSNKALATPVLSIEAIQPDSLSSVTFIVKPVRVLSHSDWAGLTTESLAKLANRYELYLDLQAFRDSNGRLVLRIYLSDRNDDKQNVQVYEVTEDSTGLFPDRRTPVNFTVTDLSQSWTGQINIPVIVAGGYPKSLVPISQAMPEFDLGEDPSRASYSVQNSLPLDLEVDDSSISVQPDCVSCWRKDSLSATISPLRVARGQNAEIHLAGTPMVWEALRKSAWKGTSALHDTLHVSIRASSFGTTKQEVDIPVRFTPPLLPLIAVILLGSLSGSACDLYLAGRRPSMRQFVTGLIYSAAAEAVAIGLITYTNSAVKLFGADIPPSQLVPAFTICFLAAGGSTLAKALTPSIPWLKREDGK